MNDDKVILFSQLRRENWLQEFQTVDGSRQTEGTGYSIAAEYGVVLL